MRSADEVRVGGPVRVGRQAALLLGANALVWVAAAAAFQHSTVLLNAGVVAYSLGLRHGFDADHIAAIDNATRKLVRDGRRAATVGFWFSLGHSSVVFAATGAVVVLAFSLRGSVDRWGVLGGMAGTAVSILFLVAIAVINGSTFVALYRLSRPAEAGTGPGPRSQDPLLEGRGLMARLCRPLFRLIRRERDLYWIGLLFGLGFDTASEIALLSLSAAAAARGLPPWTLLLLPVLFAAGMALVDSADNLLMLGICGWVDADPLRRLFYNLAVTGVSVAVALTVAMIEGLGVAASALALHGRFWQVALALSRNFPAVGGLIVLFFALGGLALWFLRPQGGGDGSDCASPVAAQLSDGQRVTINSLNSIAAIK